MGNLRKLKRSIKRNPDRLEAALYKKMAEDKKQEIINAVKDTYDKMQKEKDDKHPSTTELTRQQIIDVI